MAVAVAEKDVSQCASGEGLKRCTKCQKDKPRDEFYKNSRSVDGLFASCKQCVQQYNIQRRLSRPEGKQCCQCGQVKPRSEFRRKRDSDDGTGHNCKACSRIQSAARHIADKEGQYAEFALSTWEQVDSAVRRLAEVQAIINSERTVAKGKIDFIKDDLQTIVLRYTIAQERFRHGITAFLQGFGGRTIKKEFRFGVISYRHGKLHVSLDSALAAGLVGKP